MTSIHTQADAHSCRTRNWARDEIASLDASRDARRIVQLLYEVRFASPMLIHLLFSLAFARQVAVPAIAQVLYAGGRGPIITATRKRNDDSLLFFGMLIAHGDNEEGRRVGARLNTMHARFPISNDLYLYTLATLACFPERIAGRLCGHPVFSDKENEAQYCFWRWGAEMIGARDIPEGWPALLGWMLDYEAAKFGYTEAGSAVTRALAAEFAERWFPSGLLWLGRRIYYATFDDDLLRAHQVNHITQLERWMVGRIASVAINRILTRPDGPHRSLADMFGSEYQNRPDFQQLGPRVS